MRKKSFGADEQKRSEYFVPSLSRPLNRHTRHFFLESCWTSLSRPVATTHQYPPSRERTLSSIKAESRAYHHHAWKDDAVFGEPGYSDGCGGRAPLPRVRALRGGLRRRAGRPQQLEQGASKASSAASCVVCSVRVVGGSLLFAPKRITINDVLFGVGNTHTHRNVEKSIII